MVSVEEHMEIIKDAEISLGTLQRITEDLEYADLIRKALRCHSSTERLMYVAVFAVTGYSNTLYRESKPFNPLLGETFEWQSTDGDTRFLCEQVSCN